VRDAVAMAGPLSLRWRCPDCGRTATIKVAALAADLRNEKKAPGRVPGLQDHEETSAIAFSYRHLFASRVIILRQGASRAWRPPARVVKWGGQL